MKRFLSFSALVLAVLVLLCGCIDISSILFESDEYRAYSKFYDRYKNGITKENVIKKVGNPEYVKICDEDETSFHSIDFEDEEFLEIMMQSDCRIWIYTCHDIVRPDLGNPYKLIITFDENGETNSVEFEEVPGG